MISDISEQETIRCISEPPAETCKEIKTSEGG